VSVIRQCIICRGKYRTLPLGGCWGWGLSIKNWKQKNELKKIVNTNRPIVPRTTRTMKRRSLLAALWSIVGLLTLTSFVIAIVFACASENYDSSSSSNNNNNGGGGGGGSADDRQQNSGGAAGSAISVTSRAMVFAAIWTAVLSGILVVYGTVILGIHVPITGKYYACCRGNVHRMTPISLGAFGGSLLMFANLTLVFAILFGEFEVRQLYDGGSEGGWNVPPLSLSLSLFGCF
jgi:hypothetical protein